MCIYKKLYRINISYGGIFIAESHVYNNKLKENERNYIKYGIASYNRDEMEMKLKNIINILAKYSYR